MRSNKRQSYLECLEAALDFRETSLTEGRRGILLQSQHHSFCSGASGFKNLPPAIHSPEHLLVVQAQPVRGVEALLGMFSASYELTVNPTPALHTALTQNLSLKRKGKNNSM